MRVFVQEDEYCLDLFLKDSPRDLIFQSLKQGSRSEIIFQIKVYEKEESLLGLISDKLIREYAVIREGKYEDYSGQYIIFSEDGKTGFSDLAVFIEEFSGLTGFFLSLPPVKDTRERYILSRITLNTVKLLPPLTILSFFLPENRIVTPWVRFNINSPAGDLL